MQHLSPVALLPRFLPLLRAASRQPYLRSCREDAFQTAALAFLQAVRTYDPARGPFPAYARLRVYGALSSWYRSLSRRRARECTAALPCAPDRPDPAASAALHAAALRADLSPALRALPARERRILLTEAQGLSQSEAARRLGLSQQTVSRLRARALRRLRKRLSPLGKKSPDPYNSNPTSPPYNDGE